MISKIKGFFAKNVLEAEDSAVKSEELAAAALLVEVMVIDVDGEFLGDPKGWQSREDINKLISELC